MPTPPDRRSVALALARLAGLVASPVARVLVLKAALEELAPGALVDPARSGPSSHPPPKNPAA